MGKVLVVRTELSSPPFVFRQFEKNTFLHNVSWIESYLSGRRQRVVLNGKLSDWAPVTSGVLEGSICGPLLFICFTSDVTCTVRTNCIMYADDIKGSMPPCIDHMELLAWMQRADFSEHIQRFKLHGNPLNSPHFGAPNTKFAPTGYRRAPTSFHITINNNGQQKHR